MVNTFESRMRERFQQEVLQEQHVERQRVLAQLADTEQALAAMVKPLDEAISDAQAAERDARTKLDAATAAVREAQSRKLREFYPVDRRAELLRARLAGDLRHPAISEALETIEGIREQAKTGAETALVGVSIGAVGIKGIDRERATLFQQTTAWCVTARQELTDLQFSGDTDIAAAVAAILAGCPSM